MPTPLIPITGTLYSEKVESIKSTLLAVLNAEHSSLSPAPRTSEREAPEAPTSNFKLSTSNLREAPVLLYFDSPGGAIDGIKELADIIRNAECPTIALVGNCCTSAAYWLASQCNQIWALSPTARIGGAGAMVTFYKETEESKRLWGEEITVYAPQSTRKNEEYNELLNGNYEPYKQAILAPIAEILLTDVFNGRADKLKDATDDALRTGATLYASAALGRGWIDRILATRRELPQALETYLDTVKTDSTMETETTQNASSTKSEVGSNAPNGASTKSEVESENTSNLKLPTSNLSAASALRTSNLGPRTSEREAPTAPIAEWQSTVAELRAELEELKASLGAHAPSQPSAPDPTDGVTGVAPVSGVGVVQDSTDNLLAYCETHADDPLSCIAALRASASRK